MTVLDASAVLALIHDEPGGDVVAERLAGSVMGAANLAEVVGKVMDAELDVSRRSSDPRSLNSVAIIFLADQN